MSANATILTNITVDTYRATLAFNITSAYIGGAQMMLGIFGLCFYLFRMDLGVESSGSGGGGGGGGGKRCC